MSLMYTTHNPIYTMPTSMALLQELRGVSTVYTFTSEFYKAASASSKMS